MSDMKGNAMVLVGGGGNERVTVFAAEHMVEVEFRSGASAFVIQIDAQTAMGLGEFLVGLTAEIRKRARGS